MEQLLDLHSGRTCLKLTQAFKTSSTAELTQMTEGLRFTQAPGNTAAFFTFNK